MRAMIYRAYGGPERLESVDIPRPSPGPGQVLVRVIASSVNPVDWKLASGRLRLLMPVKLPVVPGVDVAGDIAELGAGVTGYGIGDRVHARIAANGGTGACAEFALAGSDVLARIPAGMDPAEAAGLPLAGMTALQGLRDQAGLPLEGASCRVLVVGASGGVGHIAVQISRAAGATVVGVCSLKSNAADLRDLDRLVEAGKLRVVIDSCYPLSDLRSAWQRSRSGRTAGKIVIDVGGAGSTP